MKVRDRLVISRRRMKELLKCSKEEQRALRVIQVTPNELFRSSVYATVVSSKYKELRIDLDDCFEYEDLEDILTLCEKVVVNGTTQNKTCAKIMCMIYPNKASEIRTRYLMKQNIYEVINE